MVNEIDYSTLSRTPRSFKTHQYINSELLQSFTIYESPWHISSDMDLDSIIHMHWVKPDLEDIKAKKEALLQAAQAGRHPLRQHLELASHARAVHPAHRR